jgi:predicted nucleic acid-binding protein
LGSLEQELAVHDVIGVDTAPFIYLWERHPRYFSLVKALFEHLTESGRQGITSVITLIETCVLPQRQGRQDLVQAYERALLHSRQIYLLNIDATLARRAVGLRARHGIRVPDALQVAAALQGGATAFVTNDRQLERVQVIKVLVLDDYLT